MTNNSEYIACTYTNEGLENLLPYHAGAEEELKRRFRDGEHWFGSALEAAGFIKAAKDSDMNSRYYFDAQTGNHIVTVW